jgi:hypothetical protein
LRSSSQSLTDLLRRTTWQGQDSLAFNDLWSTKHKANLDKIASELQTLANDLVKQAQQQEETSTDFNSTAHQVATDLGKQIGLAFEMGNVTFETSELNWVRWWNRIDSGHSVANLLYTAGDFKTWWKVASAPKLNAMSKKISFLKPVGNVFTGIATGIHAYKFGEALFEGNWDGALRSGVDITFDIGGAVLPVVGLSKGAFDLGRSFGDLIDDQFDITEKSSTAIVDTYVDRIAGPEGLTAAQAAELGTRYDGVSGFGNYMNDSVESFIGGLW